MYILTETRPLCSWDNIYQREIANHADDPEDEGTVWFADSGAEEKMLEYVEQLPLSRSGNGSMEDRQVRILDLGTGNGHMLFALRDEGWQAELVGVDYSESSVELARRIQQTRRAADDGSVVDAITEDSSAPSIGFELFDILGSESALWIGKGFDLVLDKGTFDAISLSDLKDAEGRTGAEAYGEKVQRLIRHGGFLLVTSCNWTEEELRKWLAAPELAYHGTIRYPSFTFGGQKGQSVSTLCFKRT